MRLAAPHPRGGGRARAVVVLDPACTLPGRGAYLCRAGAPGAPDPACLELALRRGAIARSLRRPVDLGDLATRTQSLNS